jgi:hypothetical protein
MMGEADSVIGCGNGKILSKFLGLSLSVRQWRVLHESLSGQYHSEKAEIAAKKRPETGELDRFTHKNCVFWL